MRNRNNLVLEKATPFYDLDYYKDVLYSFGFCEDTTYSDIISEIGKKYSIEIVIDYSYHELYKSMKWNCVVNIIDSSTIKPGFESFVIDVEDTFTSSNRYIAFKGKKQAIKHAIMAALKITEYLITWK